MKKISQTELDILIINHNMYLKENKDTSEIRHRFMLDEVDFTNNDLSNLNFVETYITSSLFKSQNFKNANLGGAKLYSCVFKDVIFINCNFGKTILDYAKIINSKFYNCKFIDLETLEANFEEVLFYNCTFDGAFTNCTINNSNFEECIFNSIEFWECTIDNLKVLDKNNKWDSKKIIEELNSGTIDNPIYVNGSEAIELFERKCKILNQ